jgi:predicted ATPase
VCGYLLERQILLILDGFEGLLHETGQVSRLLQALPTLRIMATSRLRLSLASEQIFLVQGLSFPAENAVENLEGYAAVQFFSVAARRHNPDFVLNEKDLRSVAAICRINQGLPLGILLTAAWANVLTPGQIITEIQSSLDFLAVDWHDLPDRQHSLRATFDHSWRLLKESERSIFLRLAVLRGSFTSERALQVAGVSLENLKSLIEQSLLQHAALDRFRIHDLLRQYAQEKLAASPDENMAVHLQYSRIFLEVLAAREKRLKSAEQPDALSEIDQEYIDITAAWGWAVGNGLVELLENAVEALRYYHLLRGLS